LVPTRALAFYFGSIRRDLLDITNTSGSENGFVLSIQQPIRRCEAMSLRSSVIAVILLSLLQWATQARNLQSFIDRISGEEPPSEALKPVKVESFPPILLQSSKRIRHYFGPLQLLGTQERTKAKSAQGTKITSEGIVFDRRLTGLCTNCMVLAAKADIYFLNGTRATISHGIYNHHLLVLDQNKHILPWYLCPGQTDLGASKSGGFMITGVAEATNYYSAPNSTVKAGYWLGSGQNKFLLNAELVNYRTESVPVYVSTEIEYVDGWPKGYMDATMSLLSVTGCKGPSFEVTHDLTRYNITGPKTTIPKDGYIVASTGHVHNGGTNIFLTLNGKVVCNSRAVYGGDENHAIAPNGKIWDTIHTMTECNEPIQVKAGDTVSTIAVYDTTAHPL
jgi:hypothetical protein